MQDPNRDGKQSFWQQQQKGQKEYRKNVGEMEQDSREEEDPQNYEPTSFYMEFDDSSDSDDFSDSEDDFIVPTTTTTALIRSGRRSPTISSYPQNNPQYNPFLSSGANKSINSSNNSNNINRNPNDHKLYGHKIIATNVLNRRRKKEISRRAQHRSNAVVIKTIYIMTTTTGERSASASPTSSPTTTPASSNGGMMMPTKPVFKSNSDSFSSKKRSKGIRSPTRNLIGTGKRQLLSSRKLK